MNGGSDTMCRLGQFPTAGDTVDQHHQICPVCCSFEIATQSTVDNAGSFVASCEPI